MLLHKDTEKLLEFLKRENALLWPANFKSGPKDCDNYNFSSQFDSGDENDYQEPEDLCYEMHMNESEYWKTLFKHPHD